MRNRSIILRVMGLGVVAVLVGWWWHVKQESAAGHHKAAAPVVGVVTAKRQDVPIKLDATGTVTALSQVDLRAQTTSTVSEVLIRDGANVRKGQVLFRFDARADQANLDKAKAQSLHDEASCADAERQYKRAVELQAQNFVAKSALDTASANRDAACALLQADRAATKANAVALSYNEIRAPFDGRVGLVNVKPGALVQANSTAEPLVTLAQINPIGVIFNVPETELDSVLQAVQGDSHAALIAEVFVPPSSVSTAQTQNTPARLSGRVTFVDNTVDSATGTIKVKAEFDNPQAALWPGQYVRVRMILKTLNNAIVIPQAAIILQGNDRFVYVIDKHQKAQRKLIGVSYVFGEQAVVSGLAAGEQVVLDGKQNLVPGSAVQIQAATTVEKVS